MYPSFNNLKKLSAKLDAQLVKLNARMHKTNTVDEQLDVNTELKNIGQKGHGVFQSIKTISIKGEEPEVAQSTCPNIS